MPLKFFTVTARDGGGEAELNGFLSSHRVLQLDRRWVDLGENSYWALCVDYLLPGTGKGSASGKGKATGPVDYREVLSAGDFAQFAKLRDFRKQIAMSEAVPPYMIFTNEQLAAIVQQKVTTKADLAKIEGIGDARVEKYGDRAIEFIRTLGGPTDATSGTTL